MTRRCIRFGSTERSPPSWGEVEHERLFGGNGALRELDDLFRAVLLLLLAPPTGAPDVLRDCAMPSALLLAEVCRKASVAFMMPNPIRILSSMSSSFPPTRTVS